VTLELVDPAQLGLSATRLQVLMSALQREVDRKRLPGAVALVARHGKIALKSSVGFLNAATGEPMHEDARFRIYSMTKPVVSVATMMLVEQGLLVLADPLSKFLPEFAKQQVYSQREGEPELIAPLKAITIHDLLRHTAGMTYEFLGASAVHRQYGQLRFGARDKTLAELTAQLAQVPLLFQPGTVFEYSRATDVLGRVIEVVSGQSLPAFLDEHIFEPLGMRDTGFSVAPAFHGHIAEPFARDPDGGMQMKVNDVRTEVALASGSGGLVSTAADYARFLQCMLGRGQFDDVQLLGPRTVDFMTTDHLGDIPVAATGSRNMLPPGHGFGLGFAVRKSLGATAEPGSAGSYYWGGLAGTAFFVDPALDMFACLMIQAPNQRDHYRALFRHLVYAAVND